MSNSDLSFSLGVGQVPSPPSLPTKWVNVLRWMVCVADYDDPALAFIAGAFSHALKYSCLTEKQETVVWRHYERILNSYDAGTLVCQCIPEA